MHKFIDLFAGVGGFRVALEQTGMRCVFSSEIDPTAKEAYQLNFNDEPYGDIMEINEQDIPAHDVLCAGFPCQSFSISGKMNGFNDNRGRLFYDIVRIAKCHRPPVLLLENVKNLVTLDNGRAITEIRTRLERIGYKVHYRVLNSSDYGIPQKRERVYIVCLNTDFPELRFVSPRPKKKAVYLEDILDDIVPNELYINGRDDIVITRSDEPEYQTKPIRIGYLGKGGQGERIYHTKGHAITLAANSGGIGARTGLYQVKDRIRRLSINECKRIMGFSDNHQVSEGLAGYTQLGNAIIPPMVRSVWDSVKVA